MVAFVLHAVGISELTMAQSQILGLFVHFTDESFYVILVALAWVFEGMLYNSIHVLWQVRKVINFAFRVQDWKKVLLLLVAYQEKPPAELSGKYYCRVIA